MIAVNPTRPAVILAYDVASKTFRVLHESAKSPIPQEYYSKPEAVTFFVNEEKTEKAYGYYYAPNVCTSSC